ncbi:MAG TPA: class I SAM-dependent methyltransferase [Pyrinomonadaceae bacterium]|nr:class I SAM-dependent methyltransferase [Pyrinomonadaceae bacterium]
MPVAAPTQESADARPEGVVRDGYRWTPQSCPVCRAAPKKYVGRRGGAAHREGLGVECEVWRCAGCGLLFPDPMPMPAGGLEQHYGLDPGEYFRNHETGGKVALGRGLLAHAERLTGGKGRVLDIGAGRGELLKAAKEEGWEAVGIEPSPQFAEWAARSSGAEVRCEPVERCEFAPGSFDVAILSGVLEHLYNPDQTIGAVSRTLRPGGALFVDVPNESGLYFRLGNLYQRLRGRDWCVNLAPTFEPYHVFGFGPRSLRALLSKHGLAARDWRVYGGQAMVPNRGGVLGGLEQAAARAVSALSNRGQLGTYIETWAVRR